MLQSVLFSTVNIALLVIFHYITSKYKWSQQRWTLCFERLGIDTSEPSLPADGAGKKAWFCCFCFTYLTKQVKGTNCNGVAVNIVCCKQNGGCNCLPSLLQMRGSDHFPCLIHSNGSIFTFVILWKLESDLS